MSDYFLSTPKIHRTICKFVDKFVKEGRLQGEGIKHLDIGPGRGELIESLGKQYNFDSYGCDYTEELFKGKAGILKKADLNVEPLPYEDSTFDVVTCAEVLEHLENHREVIREIYRVLKPGGVVVASTPNILNFRSRMRFLTFGFWNLFGPLHCKSSEMHTTGGHINPLSLFYLIHAMGDTDFKSIEWDIDKRQRGSIPGLVLAWPFIKLSAWRQFSKECRKYNTVDESNTRVVKEMNSLKVLLGRTIIVCGVK